MRFLIFLLTLTLTTSALAQGWGSCNTWAVGGSGKTTLRVQDVACFDLSDANANDSPTISTTSRQSMLEFDSDLDSATATDAAEIYVYFCAHLPASDADRTKTCGKIPLDVDADGTFDDPYLNGDDGSSSGTQRRFIFRIPRGHLFIKVKTPPASGDKTRAKLTGG